MDSPLKSGTDETEVLFLRQMVHRLNAALSKYQGDNSLDTNAQVSAEEGDPPAPWLTDPSLLSPLIQEYESHLANLVAQLAKCADQNEKYMQNFQIVSEENERLHSELADAIQQKLKSTDGHDSHPGHENLLIKNLQTQLELVTTEKEAAIEMNKETMKLLDSIRHERVTEEAQIKSREKIFFETKENNEKLTDAILQMQSTLATYRENNHAYAVSATQQATELKSCNEQLRQSKQTVREALQREEQHKTEIESLKLKVKKLESEKIEANHNYQTQFNENQRFQTALADVENKFAQALQENTDLHSKVDSLKIQVSALEKSNSEIDAKEMNYLMQIRESAQKLDDAFLDRDAAIVREKQHEEALLKSTSAMEILVQEVADRVAREVGKVKDQSSAQIQRLINEIETMELESTNLRSEVDRAKRAKRDVEDEMDQLSRQREERKDDGRLEEYQRRTLIAERAKDDMMITLQKLQDELKRTKIESQDERLRLLAHNQGLDQRVRSLQRETEESHHERLHLVETVNQQKQDVQRLKEEARLARLNATKDFTSSIDELQREKKQLEVRLKTSETTNREGMRQLHKMLADQQRITARWKEESKSSSERYEDKVKDLKSQLLHNRRRCEDLTNKLKDEPHETPVAVQRLTQLEESNRQLRAKLHQTEYKLLSATQSISEHQGQRNRMTLRDLG